MDNLLSGTECRTRNRALGHAVRCAAIMLLCVLSLCACDPYSGCRPYDYGDAKWVCEEYGAWFTVKEEENYQCYGEVVVDGKAVEVEYAFYPGGLIYIWPRYMEGSQYGARLWGGDAKYSPTELVLHSPTVNYLFDEDDEEVVFVRQELDEEPAA